jgi:catechol 2,3-dioxygenase-like lactoylglutathione lyase family enzyme
MRRAGIVVVALSVLAVIAAYGGSANTAGRPKILGIAYVKLAVSDVAKAKAFYGEKLGLASIPVRNGNFVQASFLVNENQRVDLAKGGSRTSGSSLLEIALATDHLLQMSSYLTSKGVMTTDILSWPDGTPYFEVQDPENNKIVFVDQKWVSPETGTAGAISHTLLHAGFVVKDWKAENHFYQDVLGFRLYWKGGFKDDGLDWYELQVPDGDNWIEYMLNIPADADHKELGVQNHFSLGVEKAEAAAKTLRDRGQKDFDGPEIGRDGKNALDVNDPDETRVELMEFRPMRKPCCMEYAGSHPKL